MGNKIDAALDLAEQMTELAIGERYKYLEMMTAAYLQITDIPPEDVELVEQQKGREIRWFFRKHKKR